MKAKIPHFSNFKMPTDLIEADYRDIFKKRIV